MRFEESYKDTEYLNLIRKELDEFRSLFIDWVHSFDTSNYTWDEWELFNPPHAIPPSETDQFDDDFDIEDFLNDEDE
ncbi:hypothetical protein [Flavobacterium faecale]|uniref:hypothetical protein n=1 Tax=Flavobacterium faecale TaxID=1355330 RepID=UPI003AAAE8F5